MFLDCRRHDTLSEDDPEIHEYKDKAGEHIRPARERKVREPEDPRRDDDECTYSELDPVPCRMLCGHCRFILPPLLCSCNRRAHGLNDRRLIIAHAFSG